MHANPLDPGPVFGNLDRAVGKRDPGIGFDGQVGHPGDHCRPVPGRRPNRLDVIPEKHGLPLARHPRVVAGRRHRHRIRPILSQDRQFQFRTVVIGKMFHVRRRQAEFDPPAFIKSADGETLGHGIRVVAELSVPERFERRRRLLQPEGDTSQQRQQHEREDLSGGEFHCGSR